MPSLFIFLPETAVTVFALTDMEFLVYLNCLDSETNKAM